MFPIAKAVAAHDENARFAVKPANTTAPVDAAAQRVVRRPVLGEISNTGVPSTRPTSTRPMNAGSRPGSADMEAAVDVSNNLMEAGVLDVDANDSNVPELVSDYVQRIYANFKDAELARTAKYGYMAHQSDINEKMRAILVDWLVEVHLKFKLMPETMYLTVNLIDRFLEKKLVMRTKLQLVGVTAMLLASKYEELYAPEVRDFVYITDRAYTREQILAMESAMLNALEFRITVPTSYVFLNRYLKVAQADSRTTMLATYLVERTLQEYRMIAYAPSKIAAAAVNIALRTLVSSHAWDNTMVHYSGFTEEELRPAVMDIQTIVDNGATSSLQAVRKKYQQPRFGEVANIPIAHLTY